MSSHQHHFTKTAVERYRQTVDFSKALSEGARITACAVSASRIPDGADVTADVLGSSDAEVSGKSVVILVKNGDAGKSYKLRFFLDVDTGERLEEEVVMAVEAGAQRPAPALKRDVVLAGVLIAGIAAHNADPGAADEAYLERAARIKPLAGKPPDLPELARDGSLKGTKGGK